MARYDNGENSINSGCCEEDHRLGKDDFAISCRVARGRRIARSFSLKSQTTRIRHSHRDRFARSSSTA